MINRTKINQSSFCPTVLYPEVSIQNKTSRLAHQNIMQTVVKNTQLNQLLTAQPLVLAIRNHSQHLLHSRRQHERLQPRTNCRLNKRMRKLLMIDTFHWFYGMCRTTRFQVCCCLAFAVNLLFLHHPTRRIVFHSSTGSLVCNFIISQAKIKDRDIMGMAVYH